MKPYEKIDLREQVDPVALEDEERDALYELARTYAVKRRRRWPKMVATAAAVIFLLGGLSPSVRATVGRVAEQVQVSFSEAFGGSARGNELVVKVHETVVLGDQEFVVEDVLPVGQELYITTLHPQDALTPDDSGLWEVYVNGEKFTVEGSGGYREVRSEEGVVLEAMRVSLDKPLPEAEKWEMELVFKDHLGAKATVTTTVDPQVLRDRAVQLVEDYSIPGAEGYVLRNFVLTPAVQVGILEVPGDMFGRYDWHFEAVDEEGRMAYIQWLSGHPDEEANVGVFELGFSPVVSSMTADELIEAPALTWTLYRENVNLETGNRYGDAIQVGESFVLENPQTMRVE